MDTYTGTANVDVVSGAVANIQNADRVDGGAGTADVLNITDSGILDMTAAGANVIGFEVMNLQGTSGNAITLGTLAGNFTTINGSSGVDNITVTSITSATTLAAGAGADRLSSATAFAATDLDKVTGVETIVNTATGAQNITAVDALVATGATLTLNLSASNAAVGASVINFSAETDGNLVITGVGTAGQTATYTLGKGNDQLTLSTTATAVDTLNVLNATSGLDKITNFTSGTDNIKFTATGFTATNGAVGFAVDATGDIETVTAAGAAGTALAAGNEIIVWNVASTTAANLNTALATQNGVTSKAALIVYTNSSTGFTTIAYDSNIADASNTVVDLLQIVGVAATGFVAADLQFV